MLCPSCGADADESSRYCSSCGASLTRVDEDYIGRTIARKYRVEALIGEGGMGKVYRVRQVDLDKIVVLKVLRHSLLSDERTVARFRREAKAASRLNHPNSISILDFGQTEDGALYIAMEFVPGEDLHNVLSKVGPLPEARIIRIISQVLSALADAHAVGVIHRDLKPENIMVEQRRNEPDLVKVLDFGIAKIQDATDGPALTRAGFVCGTPEYMSPEQARGATLDHRSDLYAVGVILYQLATGVLPFEADSAVGFATKHLNEEPVAPSKRRPGVRISSALERLILRALSKNPDERPADAEAFRAELLAIEHERYYVRSSAVRTSSAPERGSSKEQYRDVPRASRSEPPLQRLPMVAQGRSTRHLDRPAAQRSSITELELRLRAWIGNSWVLRVAVAGVALVLLGVLGWGGFTLYRRLRSPLPAPVVVVPPVATPAGRPAPTAIAPRPDRPAAAPELPLYERRIPGTQQDAEAARRFTLLGDEAYGRGDLQQAAFQYERAFRAQPDPELSLKLGEVYWHRNERRLALAWWRRHLSDSRNSRARPYIEQALPELAALP